MDEALEHDLGARRHLQVGAEAFRRSRCARRATGPRTGIRTAYRAPASPRASIVAGIGAERDRHRKRLAADARAMIAKIERAAAMREPAHDELVAARSPAGGRCRGSGAACAGPRVTVRPQVISGPASPGQQVCIGSRARSTSPPSQHDLLARRAERSFGAMSQHLPDDRAACPRRRAGPCGGSGSFR